VLGLTTFQASAYHWWFDLVNDTGSTLVSVRATNIDDPSFHGRDLLGDYIFRPGQHMRIEPVPPRATVVSTWSSPSTTARARASGTSICAKPPRW
jgi:hypothetical protein